MNVFTDEEVKKLQAIIDSIPDYFDDLEEVRCPVCGHTQSFEISEPHFYDEDTHVYTCTNDDCKKKFEMSSNMHFTWSTEEVYE